MQNIIVAGSSTPKVVPRFLTLPELHHFLFSEAKSKNAGVLQEMVHHHGNKRRGLRCHWSPHIANVEMCVNRWNVTNTKVDIDHRMADVHGRRGDILVSKLDVATKLGHRIKTLSDVLAKRIEQIINMSRDGRLMVDMSKMTTGSSLVQEGHEKMLVEKAAKANKGSPAAATPVAPVNTQGSPSSLASAVFAKNAAKSIAMRAAMTEEELALEALAHAHAAKEARAGGGLPKQIVPYGASTVLPNSAEYFAQYIKGASFETKRNLLGIRFKRGTFNFAIGDDNRTYLTYACGVEIVDRQPAYQKRKKRSNAHTLEIEMLETATHKLRDMHKEAPHKPQPSPILEKMGLGLLPRPEEDFYKNYSNQNYEPEPDGDAPQGERDQLAGTGFSVREMLRDGAEMLRAFFRRYAHAKTGKLNLRSVFRSLDTSGDGMISSTEFRDLFREVNIHLTRNQLFQVVRLFDEDCDGRVSIDEFESWIMTEPVKRDVSSIVDKSDDVFNVRQALRTSSDDPGLSSMSPWGQRLVESGGFAVGNGRPSRKGVDSVLTRRMRSVGDETKVHLLNTTLEELGNRGAARAAELGKELMAKGLALDDGKSPAERAAATVLGEDALQDSLTLGKKGDAGVLGRVPKSVEKAYGRYRAHYLSSITVPMTQQSRNAKAAGFQPSPRSKAGRGTGRILRLSQPRRAAPQPPPKKEILRNGVSILPSNYYNPGHYGKIYGRKVTSNRKSSSPAAAAAEEEEAAATTTRRRAGTKAKKKGASLSIPVAPATH
jgi:hypothetical protein